MPERTVRDRLIDLLGAYFTELAPEQIPDASPATVSDWDSMAAVTLIAMIQEEFGIEVAPEDYSEFVSFERILNYLEKTRNIV